MLDPSVLERNRRLVAVMVPLNQILAKISWYGLPISEKVLRFKAERWKSRIVKAKHELFEIVGKSFNLDSGGEAGQMAKVLYTQLGMDRVYEKGKVTVNQYALAKMHYLAKKEIENINDNLPHELSLEDAQKRERVLFLIRQVKLLRHRYSNFVIKFLNYEPCDCDDDTRHKCEHCGGTEVGHVTGYDDRYVSERDGWWWLHATLRQTPNTLRLAAGDPNVQQFAKYDKRFDIYTRDIVVAPPGWSIIECDDSKSERRGAAVIFRDTTMFKEILEGATATSKFASEALRLPLEKCLKGQPYYEGGKIIQFMLQYFGSDPAKVQQIVLKVLGIWLTLEQCQVAIDHTYKKYGEYYRNAREFVWSSYLRGWCRSYQGAVLTIGKDPNLAGFSDWRQFYKSQEPKGKEKSARFAFEKLCRAITAFVVQSSMTGMGHQFRALKVQDMLDRMSKEEWLPYRCVNGDWINGPRLMNLKHDSVIVLCPDPLVEEVKAKIEKILCDFEAVGPYLEPHPDQSLQFHMQVESRTTRQWGVELPDNYFELTEDRNPNYFFKEGVMSRA
jgi:hypothetical protein